MKRENKIKAGNLDQKLPASTHSVLTLLKGSLPFVNSIAITYFIVCLMRLGVLLRRVKFCILFMRIKHDEKVRAINYSKS